jgi:hypothetical protein
MTSMLLSPSHIAAPVQGRYLTGDRYPRLTATVSAAFDRQNPDRLHETTVAIPHTTTKINAAVISSAVVPVRNPNISAYTGDKSP